jgi:hypothetical protein
MKPFLGLVILLLFMPFSAFAESPVSQVLLERFIAQQRAIAACELTVECFLKATTEFSTAANYKKASQLDKAQFKSYLPVSKQMAQDVVNDDTWYVFHHEMNSDGSIDLKIKSKKVLTITYQPTYIKEDGEWKTK